MQMGPLFEKTVSEFPSC